MEKFICGNSRNMSHNKDLGLIIHFAYKVLFTVSSLKQEQLQKFVMVTMVSLSF
jgi:hypothetical protein